MESAKKQNYFAEMLLFMSVLRGIVVVIKYNITQKITSFWIQTGGISSLAAENGYAIIGEKECV